MRHPALKGRSKTRLPLCGKEDPSESQKGTPGKVSDDHVSQGESFRDDSPDSMNSASLYRNIV